MHVCKTLGLWMFGCCHLSQLTIQRASTWHVPHAGVIDFQKKTRGKCKIIPSFPFALESTLALWSIALLNSLLLFQSLSSSTIINMFLSHLLLYIILYSALWRCERGKHATFNHPLQSHHLSHVANRLLINLGDGSTSSAVKPSSADSAFTPPKKVSWQKPSWAQQNSRFVVENREFSVIFGPPWLQLLKNQSCFASKSSEAFPYVWKPRYKQCQYFSVPHLT